MATYKIAEQISETDKNALSTYSPLQQQLLHVRGIVTTKDADSFCNPSYEDGLNDPFLLHDMKKAVARILAAITNNEHIVIFSDYDCDGIPGAVVLHDFFKEIGYDNFSNYIPHRHYEGFGFSSEAAEKVHDAGAALVVTIDCGTTSVDAVAKANELGIDVIITDHHEPGATLPKAVALVNPKIGTTYPFTGLCGAGVVFKLVQALLSKGDFDVREGREKWWLDMVGIATIADMVPLTGENRVLATYGLHVLRKSRRPGLQQLLRMQKADQRFLTEDDIGFTIGPRVNAASRMDTPEDAFFMLAEKDETVASGHVAHLEKLNAERKTLVAGMTKEIHKRMKEVVAVPDVIVMGNPSWRPSLVGLTANKLAEEYNRPVFIWGRDGNGTIKGSCRSNGQVSVVRLMEQIAHVFSEHGGHHQAGGFAVLEEHIHTLPTLFNEAYGELGAEAYIVEEVCIDSLVHLDDITAAFIADQQRLAPFGVDNPKPLYMIENVIPTEVGLFGKTKEHTKIRFATEGLAREAIAFFKKPDAFQKEPKTGESVSIVAHVEQSYFMGRQQTRLRIVDVI